MGTRSLVLFVLFVMVMFIWLLTLLGAVAFGHSGWIPFFAVALLGLMTLSAKEGVR